MDTIDILIQNGADVNAKNDDGNTALHSTSALGISIQRKITTFRKKNFHF